MKHEIITYGIWTAVIVFSISMFCAFLLSGCVTEPARLVDSEQVEKTANDSLKQTKPELNDSEELADAKEALAQSRQKWTKEKEILTAELSSIRGKSNAEISKLQEQLAQQKRLNEQIIRQADETFYNEQFPYQWFYGGAGLLILGVIAMAYRKRDVVLIGFGVAGAVMLIGIATAQKMYPEYLMYCALACAAPVVILVVVLCVSWMRKEWAIQTLAQAIENDQHNPKAIIKNNTSIAKRIEKQIRKYIPNKTKSGEMINVNTNG